MYRPGRGKAGRFKKVFRTKKEAEAYESEVLRQHAEGREVDDRAARSTTVGELWSQFRAHIMEHGVRGGRKLKPKTLANYDFKYRTYIEDDWQYTPVSGVTRERCRTWLADMTSASGEPVSNNARNDGAAVFRNLLNFGLNQGLLSYNPMKDRSGSPLPTPAIESRRANVYLTVPQLMRLSSLCSNAELLVLTAGLTGLRLNEITGMTAQEVHLGASPNVFVPKERSKTNEARTVPLPGQVAERLRATGIESRDGDSPAFPAAQGGHWSHSFLGKKFRAAAERATTVIADLQDALNMPREYTTMNFDGGRRRVAMYGEHTERAVRDFQNRHGLEPTGTTDGALWEALGLIDLSSITMQYTEEEPDRDMPARPVFHDLRHTAVSLAIRANVSIKMVQKMAGHSSATMTLDVYGHLYPEDDATAADAMTTLLSKTLQEELPMGS